MQAADAEGDGEVADHDRRRQGWLDRDPLAAAIFHRRAGDLGDHLRRDCPLGERLNPGRDFDGDVAIAKAFRHRGQLGLLDAGSLAVLSDDDGLGGARRHLGDQRRDLEHGGEGLAGRDLLTERGVEGRRGAAIVFQIGERLFFAIADAVLGVEGDLDDTIEAEPRLVHLQGRLFAVVQQVDLRKAGGPQPELLGLLPRMLVPPGRIGAFADQHLHRRVQLLRRPSFEDAVQNVGVESEVVETDQASASEMGADRRHRLEVGGPGQGPGAEGAVLEKADDHLVARDLGVIHDGARHDCRPWLRA